MIAAGAPQIRQSASSLACLAAVENSRRTTAGVARRSDCGRCENSVAHSAGKQRTTRPSKSKTSGRRAASTYLNHFALEQRIGQLFKRRLERRDFAGQLIGAGGLLLEGNGACRSADQ